MLVIPAKAGFSTAEWLPSSLFLTIRARAEPLDSRLRGNDEQEQQRVYACFVPNKLNQTNNTAPTVIAESAILNAGNDHDP